MNYVPFTPDLLPAASTLLAQRHRLNHTHLPELPERFQEVPVATQALEAVLAHKTTRGFAAMRAGQLVAYLIGETSVQSWGRCGYVYLPGYGLAADASPDILQDLYALLGETWNQHGCFNHYVYICAADTAVVNAWFNLGFGKEREDALLNLSTATIPDIESPTGIEIRRVVKGDNAHLASLSDTIWRHQAQAPRWHPMMPEEIERQTTGWAEIADTESDLAYLALEGQTALGSLAFYIEEEKDDDLTIPPHCRYMTAAATRPAQRGRGISTALTWHGLQQIRAEGAEYCLTNWQSANLLAARFWPRFGFKTVAFRLARTINANIAWARG